MRYLSLTIGIVSMLMSLNGALSSDDFISNIRGPEENKKIAESIFEKAGTSADVSALTREEKEWLYETELLDSVKKSQQYGYSDSEDLSNVLGELADFYDYKGRGDLSNEVLKMKAELDLKCALMGDEATLGIFNSMIRSKELEDSFFQEIINLYQENPDAFVDGKYSHLIETNGFQEHVTSLAQAYKKSFPETLKIRQQNNVPIIPLYDQALQLELLERIKRRNNHQGE
ncbi:hypothetical protein [Candidatus Odyssella thessalonicensis]|uniref:hypothetical protein n=1 Tax=Candidatus Odyssella thessalonicensis TaxID=84647 RepID=UPI00094AFE49|nr:hypothetical protein [Candidatus Odyssella thessalonicensis]